MERSTEDSGLILGFSLATILGAFVWIAYVPYVMLYIYNLAIFKFTEVPMDYGKMFLMFWVIGLVMTIFRGRSYADMKFLEEDKEDSPVTQAKLLAVYTWSRILSVVISQLIIMLIAQNVR